LRRRAERGERIDHSLFADNGDPGNIDMRQQAHTGTQVGTGADRAERSDLHVLSEAGTGGNP
jgi:hypothetical protein